MSLSVQQTVKAFPGSQGWIKIQLLDGSSGPGWADPGPSGGPSHFVTLGCARRRKIDFFLRLETGSAVSRQLVGCISAGLVTMPV